MRWGKTLLAIMTVLGLAACDPSPRLAPLNEGLDAPEDLNVLSDGVDPLIVGHASHVIHASDHILGASLHPDQRRNR